MDSPFPGMDPYLERHWRDVHTSLITEARNTLNERLPEDLIASAEERIAIESEAEEPGGVSPDVSVLETVGTTSSAQPAPVHVGLAPYRLVVMLEPITERFIQIFDATGERVVTVIEFVSSTNKLGAGLKEFVCKRENLLQGGVNFVEVDLNRTGNWRGLMRPHRCPSKMISTYRATIRVPDDSAAIYLQPIWLREPLPVVAIPLRTGETPVQLPLQPLLNRAYRAGRYERRINYAQSPEPPFEGDEARWADELLRKAGKR